MSAAWMMRSTLVAGSLDEMLELARRYGATAQRTEQCLNPEREQLLVALRQKALEQRPIKSTPGVVLNGKLLPRTYFAWRLRERMKK